MNKLFQRLAALLAGLLLVGGVKAPARTKRSNKDEDIKEKVLKVLPIVRRACAEHSPKVPLPLALAVLHIESHGHRKAVSKAGAMGYMQLMPSTAKMLGVTDPFDAEQNINGGVELLSQLFRKYQNWPKVLAVYNSGNPNVIKRKEYINLVFSKLPLYKDL